MPTTSYLIRLHELEGGGVQITNAERENSV